LKKKLLCNIKTLCATHKEQSLHGAVGSHRLCNAKSAIGADVISVLQKNCGSVEFTKYNTTETKLKKNVQQN
jgi:hypothetical protein